MNDAIRIESVSKRYDEHVAVDDLSIAIPRGVIYGILGPNGAGKTTTLRMAMNIIARDCGHISVLGKDPSTHLEVLRSIGYLPEERGLYKKMKVLDVIVFFGQLKGLKESEARARALSWLEKMGLTGWTHARVEALSKGMQQKVQFIATVLHEPELLVLDEPASGLDPVNQEVLRNSIFEAKAQGRTVIFSTHNMEQAEQMCDSVCIIAGGKKVLNGALKEIRTQHAGRRYRADLESKSDVERTLKRMQTAADFVIDHRIAEQSVEFELAEGASSRDAFRLLADAEVGIEHFFHIQPTLREIFVRYAGNAAVSPKNSTAN